MSKAGERLVASLKEAKAFAQGKLALPVTTFTFNKDGSVIRKKRIATIQEIEDDAADMG